MNKRFDLFLKTLITLCGILTVPMCKTLSPLEEAHLAYSNENYQGAKETVRRTIEERSYSDFNRETEAGAYYFLAAIHAQLAEYDSMKKALDDCVKNDANFQKAKRELLESYSIFEFNRGVESYNNFFFDKAISHFEQALFILKNDLDIPEYEGALLRSMAFAAAGTGNIERAISYCKRAADIGDHLSRRVLEIYNEQKKIDKPEKLEPRRREEIKI